MRSRLVIALVCAAGALPMVAGAQEVAEPTPVVGVALSVNDLLDRLEVAGADVTRLSAQVRYTRTFAIAGDRQTRDGQLFFDTTGATKRFAVRFEKLILEGGRVDDEVQEYVFDGEWYVERRPATRQFVKRQVVPPGEVFDPLKVGEGPFPLPIGQKKDDILREYEASVAASADDLPDSLRSFVTAGEGTHRLTLVPLDPGADVQSVDVWYRTGSLLPKLAKTVNAEGDVSYVQLINVRQNDDAVFPERIFSIRTPGPRDGWDVRVEPWREGAR